MPQLWILAGPNGAGKSTLANKYLAGRLPIVNPDVIAQALAPTDPHGTQVRVQAGREAVRRQEGASAGRGLAHIGFQGRNWSILA